MTSKTPSNAPNSTAQTETVKPNTPKAAPAATATSQTAKVDAASAAKVDSEKSADTLAKETTEAAKSRSDELKAKAKVEARELSEKAKTMAEAKAEEAKGYASSEIERQAEYIRSAGREYGDDSYQAHAADYLASNLHHAAEVIRDRDVSSLMDDVSGFARRNPALFLGGAALLGFAAARLLKASERSTAPRAYDRVSYDDRFDAPTPTRTRSAYDRHDMRTARMNGGFPQ